MCLWWMEPIKQKSNKESKKAPDLLVLGLSLARNVCITCLSFVVPCSARLAGPPQESGCTLRPPPLCLLSPRPAASFCSREYSLASSLLWGLAGMRQAAGCQDQPPAGSVFLTRRSCCDKSRSKTSLARAFNIPPRQEERMKSKARGGRRRIPHRGQEDEHEIATEGEEDVKPNYVRKKRSRNRKTDTKTTTRKKVNDARTPRPSPSGRTGGGRTRGSRKAAGREREEGEAIPRRAKNQETGTRKTKARKKNEG